MIEVHDLTKSYGRLNAVDGVSFSVDAGEIVGLLGPNGAGKTTIMRVLTCYHYPSAGTARIDGFDVAEDPLAVKARLGYLPENAPIYGDLTVLEYLEFIADARELAANERDAAIERAVELCGLGGTAYRPVDQLSKGYRQRVGLAQAILHDPPILILDEPTSGLDPNQIIEIRSLIRALGSKKTVILSTHILQEVEAVCDRVLILNRGVIAASGTTEQIAAEMKGEATVTLEVSRGAEREATDPRELGIEELGRVVDSRTMGQWSRVRLALRSGTASEDVFRWAVSRDLILRELCPERVSLEQVFAELTRDDDAGGAQ